MSGGKLNGAIVGLLTRGPKQYGVPFLPMTKTKPQNGVGMCGLSYQAPGCVGVSQPLEYRIDWRTQDARQTWRGEVCGPCARAADDRGEVLSAVRLPPPKLVRGG